MDTFSMPTNSGFHEDILKFNFMKPNYFLKPNISPLNNRMLVNNFLIVLDLYKIPAIYTTIYYNHMKEQNEILKFILTACVINPYTMMLRF